MPKSFSLGGLNLAALKDPRVSVRAALGALLLCNVIAALILFKPWGGSADDLERRIDTMRAQLPQQQAALARTKTLVEKVQKARAEGDKFMSQYMLDERTAYSSVLGELDRDATQVGLKSREIQANVEPIDGSDTLGMMTISANYEGPYPNLTKFINALDRSKQFLIIESLQASPQPVGQAVNVNFKLNTFVRAEAGELQ
jgi:type II secretory pathway component PulM